MARVMSLLGSNSSTLISAPPAPLVSSACFIASATAANSTLVSPDNTFIHLSTSSESLSSTVFITLERLQELEAIERNLPKMIENAIQENKRTNLLRLHEKDKNNPESVNLRVKRYALRHKETLNARRRAKREQEKKAQSESVSPQNLPGASPISTAPSNPYISTNMITVRFDD